MRASLTRRRVLCAYFGPNIFDLYCRCSHTQIWPSEHHILATSDQWPDIAVYQESRYVFWRVDTSSDWLIANLGIILINLMQHYRYTGKKDSNFKTKNMHQFNILSVKFTTVYLVWVSVNKEYSSCIITSWWQSESQFTFPEKETELGPIHTTLWKLFALLQI